MVRARVTCARASRTPGNARPATSLGIGGEKRGTKSFKFGLVRDDWPNLPVCEPRPRLLRCRFKAEIFDEDLVVSRGPPGFIKRSELGGPAPV